MDVVRIDFFILFFVCIVLKTLLCHYYLHLGISWWQIKWQICKSTEFQIGGHAKLTIWKSNLRAVDNNLVWSPFIIQWLEKLLHIIHWWFPQNISIFFADICFKTICRKLDQVLSYLTWNLYFLPGLQFWNEWF